MISCGGVFDLDGSQKRLAEVQRHLTDPEVWEDQKRLQALNKEQAKLEHLVQGFVQLRSRLSDSDQLLVLAKEETDDALFAEIQQELTELEEKISQFEFRRMFHREADPNHAFLELQSGSGGTEAQDWTEMLLRMYLRWCEDKGFATEIVELSPGEVAGVKSVTIRVAGDYAYGWLRTETGVHRLVRKSPFDSGNRRHTSFAAVFVMPELDDHIEVALNMSDCRIDTYRASGAGGQHVNKTDSAVRITHLPTNIVVQCQNQRSQHQNKDNAIKQLKAKLYEIESQKKRQDLQELEESKTDIGWGNQIRSYVLDSGRIKDLRTGVETGNCQAVLNGDLDQFIMESLKQQV